MKKENEKKSDKVNNTCLLSKERGSITLFILIIGIFFMAVLLLINIGIMGKNANQEKELDKISKNYQVTEDDMEYEHLKALGQNPSVTLDEVKQLINELKLEMYPVGSIYISTEATNPQDIFGGKWESYGQGKTLVGQDSSQQEFDTINETGGEKTHTLSVNEMPSHNHSIPSLSGTAESSGTHTHSYSKANNTTGGTAITIAQMPSHTHTQNAHTHISRMYFAGYTGWTYETTPQGYYVFLYNSGALLNQDQLQRQAYLGNGKVGYTESTIATNKNTGGGQAHTHSISYTDTNTSSTGAHTHKVSTDTSSTGNAGSGKEFTNLQPYIVTYMWRRTE